MRSRPVRRAVVVAAVVGAAGLGVVSGLGLHRAFSDPPASTPTPSASSAPPSDSPTPTPIPTTTPKATPSPKSTKTSPSKPDDGPAFTQLALLLPAEFEEYGWLTARVIQHYDELPTPPITPCTTIGRGPGFVQAYAAIYTSNKTNAAEVAARFESVGEAKDAFTAMRKDVKSCAAAAKIDSRRTIGKKTVPPAASRVSELTWWRTRDPQGGPLRGVIGMARADDRVLVINLESDLTGSDPVDTTDIDSLLIQATRRLV